MGTVAIQLKHTMHAPPGLQPLNSPNLHLKPPQHPKPREQRPDDLIPPALRDPAPARRATTIPPPPESPFLQVSFPHPGVCEVALARPPVNALHTATWEALHALLVHLETKCFPRHVRALVLRSGLRDTRGVFSAGLDLRELRAVAGRPAAFHALWRAAAAALSALHASPLHTLAALDGAAPAAGCALALACDVRVATARSRIGLDEVAAGVPVPAVWAELLVRAANSRPAAEAALADGTLLDARAARRLHVVSRVVPAGTGDGALRCVALRMARRAADVGVKCALARARTKQGLRADFVKRWRDGVEEEARVAHAAVIAARDAPRPKL